MGLAWWRWLKISSLKRRSQYLISNRVRRNSDLSPLDEDRPLWITEYNESVTGNGGCNKRKKGKINLNACVINFFLYRQRLPGCS